MKSLALLGTFSPHNRHASRMLLLRRQILALLWCTLPSNDNCLLFPEKLICKNAIGFAKRAVTYHNNRLLARFKSKAIVGRPTVKRPVLKLLTVVIPVSVAITATVRPFESCLLVSTAVAWSSSSGSWRLGDPGTLSWRFIEALLVLMGAIVSKPIIKVWDIVAATTYQSYMLR